MRRYVLILLLILIAALLYRRRWWQMADGSRVIAASQRARMSDPDYLRNLETED